MWLWNVDGSVKTRVVDFPHFDKMQRNMFPPPYSYTDAVYCCGNFVSEETIQFWRKDPSCAVVKFFQKSLGFIITVVWKQQQQQTSDDKTHDNSACSASIIIIIVSHEAVDVRLPSYFGVLPQGKDWVIIQEIAASTVGGTNCSGGDGPCVPFSRP